MALVVKNLPASAGDIRDIRSIPGSRKSPGGGQKTHPSFIACGMPWTEEPGGLQPIESHRVGHN